MEPVRYSETNPDGNDYSCRYCGERMEMNSALWIGIDYSPEGPKLHVYGTGSPSVTCSVCSRPASDAFHAAVAAAFENADVELTTKEK